MRIILLGKMAAGKDTVANILCEYHVFYRYSFATKLKEIAESLFPDEFKSGKPRKLLQDIGSKMREIHPDCWADYLLRHANRMYDLWTERQVITDCRYRNELEIAEKNGFIPVRVMCHPEIRLKRLQDRDGFVDPETFDHASETELDSIHVEHKIDNNGNREDLRSNVFELIEKLLKEKQCM
ncbi:MAG: hypothetical protein K6U74_01075 [Firmicutes bacterium]|nr:hypothetical protein [Bacillota bacterium]